MSKKKAFLESFHDLLKTYDITSAMINKDPDNKENRVIVSFTMDPKGEKIKITAEEILAFCGFKSQEQ